MDRLASDRMFAAVVETGSFAGAAQRLGTSSGYASKLVAKIEGELGVRLLHRTTRALQLTEAGQTYYNRVRGILDELDQLYAEMRSTSTTPRGKVRVTAPLTFGTLKLAPIFADFAKAYPEVSLEVQFTDRVVSLVDEGFDLAVRVGRPKDSTLVARKLIESGIVTVASPDYLARRGTPEVPHDLAQHDCILDTNFGDPYRWPFADGVEVRVSGRLIYSDASACLVAAEAGLGIAYLPDFVAAESLREGRVVQVLSDHENSPSAVYAMTPSGRHPAAKVRVLIETLAQSLRRS